jgi:hypothetical protein
VPQAAPDRSRETAGGCRQPRAERKQRRVARPGNISKKKKSFEQQIQAAEKFQSRSVGWLVEQWQNSGQGSRQLAEEIRSIFGACQNKHTVVLCRSRNGNGLSQL